MHEAEFDERLKAIQIALDALYNFQPIQTSTYCRNQLNIVAANLMQIQEGIKRYARPKDWELLQEGVPI